MKEFNSLIDEDELSDEQLEIVAGGMSRERFEMWIAELFGKN